LVGELETSNVIGLELFLASAEVVSLSFIVLFEVNKGSVSTCALKAKVAVDKSMKKIRIEKMDAHNLFEYCIS
jgi:hypothetical protein